MTKVTFLEKSFPFMEIFCGLSAAENQDHAEEHVSPFQWLNAQALMWILGYFHSDSLACWTVMTFGTLSVLPDFPKFLSW